MNKYLAYYKGDPKEIEAETSYQAQQIGDKLFKIKRKYEHCTVYLVEKNGVPVVHVATE